MKRILLFCLVLSIVSFAAQAQSQYTIYPVPQAQDLTGGEARLSGTVNIVAEPGIDEATVARAREVLAEHGIASQVNGCRKEINHIVPPPLPGVFMSSGITSRAGLPPLTASAMTR